MVIEGLFKCVQRVDLQPIRTLAEEQAQSSLPGGLADHSFWSPNAGNLRHGFGPPPLAGVVFEIPVQP